jgi:hypothetical protein
MIEDNEFRELFQEFCEENGHMIVAGTDEFGDNTVETRASLDEIIAEKGKPVVDLVHEGRRFIVIRQKDVSILAADHGEARIVFEGKVPNV